VADFSSGWAEENEYQIKLLLNINPYFFFRINQGDIVKYPYFVIAIGI